MAIYEITKDSLLALPTTTFSAQDIRERYDLQRLLRTHIEAIAPETYVLAEEYGEWEDAKRRIDLPCMDKAANLVVVELKRSEGRWPHGFASNSLRSNDQPHDLLPSCGGSRKLPGAAWRQ
jgi:RecB family endonuclease NucS